MSVLEGRAYLHSFLARIAALELEGVALEQI
jgi:hypothetical protein